jgi:hypothetical protein
MDVLLHGLQMLLSLWRAERRHAAWVAGRAAPTSEALRLAAELYNLRISC